jgi:hypothetical protein
VIHNLHGTKGKTPPGAVRICRPTRWGNPYPVGPIYSRAQAIDAYRRYLPGKLKDEPFFLEPPRQDLACWCSLCLSRRRILEWLEVHDEPH